MILSPSARRAIDDLTWFWTEADGDMGLCSSFGPMVAMLQSGGPTGGRPIMEIPEHQLHAATRRRVIARALEQLGETIPEHRSVLETCLGRGGYRPELGAALAAPLTTAARRAWRSSASARPIVEWLARLYQRARHGCGEHPAVDRLLVTTIEREAESLLLEALREYAAVRRGQDVCRRMRDTRVI